MKKNIELEDIFNVMDGSPLDFDSSSIVLTSDGSYKLIVENVRSLTFGDLDWLSGQFNTTNIKINGNCEVCTIEVGSIFLDSPEPLFADGPKIDLTSQNPDL